MHRRVTCIVAALALGATALSAEAGAAPEKQVPLRIMVTNDDGVSARGIDVLAKALRTVPGVKVSVVAPVEDKSGTGSSTTPGTLKAIHFHTVSGYPALAVAGFPADTVIYAVEQGGLAKKPDLVISGINKGQNVGAAVDLSGTIGAAKAAAARGIPALAVSQGVRPPGDPDYAAGAKEAVRWLKKHLKALTAKKKGAVVLDNLNVPSCTTGQPRGLVDVAVAGADIQGIGDPQDCTSTATNAPDDVDALKSGYVTLTHLPIPTP